MQNSHLTQKADLKRLDKAFAKQVLKGIAKVRRILLPVRTAMESRSETSKETI